MKKTNTYTLILIILLGISLRAFFMEQKEYFHHDTVFSLETINGDKFADKRTNEQYSDQWIDGSSFKTDTQISADERWRFDHIDKALKYYDLHPPLHYYCIHTVNILLNDGQPDYWPGLVFNIFIYCISVTFLYLTASLLYSNKLLVFSAPIIFSILPLCISMTMLVRMYELAVCCSIITLYASLSLYQKRGTLLVYILLVISTTLGGLSHYYALIYTFSIFSLLSLIFISEQKYKECFAYIGLNLAAGILFLIIWPGFLYQVSNHPFISTILNLQQIEATFYASVALLTMSALGLIILRKSRFRKESLLILIATIITYIFILKLRPYSHPIRYFYILIPNIILTFLIIYDYIYARYLNRINEKVEIRLNRESEILATLPLRRVILIIPVIGILSFSQSYNFFEVEYLDRDKFSENSVLQNYRESNRSIPVVIVRNYTHQDPKFNPYHKDWMMVKLMPLLYDRKHVYMVNEKDFNLTLIERSIQKFSNSQLYIYSPSIDHDMQTALEKKFQYSAQQQLRYKKLYHYYN